MSLPRDRQLTLQRLTQHGDIGEVTVEVAEEVPVEVRYNGIYYVIMMMSPSDLEDFAVGFSITEGIIGTLDEVKALDVTQARDGYILNIAVRSQNLRVVLGRRKRAIPASTGCGICGGDRTIFSQDVPQIQGYVPSQAAVFYAIDHIGDKQLENKRVHMLHASAWCNKEGEITLIREDIGRHNSLDKLIGAMTRRDDAKAGGFCLITSRCSFEMVKKALWARMGCLVAISGATWRAIDMAKKGHLTLFFKVKKDAIFRVIS